MIMTFFLLVVRRLKHRQQQLPVSKGEAIDDLKVAIEPPREEYVEEWEFSRRITEGFQTKEEALGWLKQDPSLDCEYCGGRLRSTFTGEREAIQLVTFYKAVPAGAKDLRVVLGSFWFPKYATELRCSRCGRLVQR
jgi:DNA-directed RNA polymerase subunit RPC12/RpoP